MKINEIVVEGREITNEVIPAVLGAIGRAGVAAGQRIGRAGAAAARGTAGAARTVKQKIGAAGAAGARAGSWAKQQAQSEVEVPWELRSYADPGVGLGRTLAGGFLGGLTGRMPDAEDLTPWKRKGGKTATQQTSPTPAPAARPAPTPAPAARPAPTPARPKLSDQEIQGSVKVPNVGTYLMTPAGWFTGDGKLVTSQENIDFLDRERDRQMSEKGKK